MRGIASGKLRETRSRMHRASPSIRRAFIFARFIPDFRDQRGSYRSIVQPDRSPAPHVAQSYVSVLAVNYHLGAIIALCAPYCPPSLPPSLLLRPLVDARGYRLAK